MNNCTLWPDRFGDMNWSHCCLLHDVAYDLGLPRATADWELYTCVMTATHAHWFAGLMFVAVSVFGWIFYQRRGATERG
jgi:hypothetical protein